MKRLTGTKTFKFPLSLQSSMMDCGPTCLQMVARYYGKFYNIDTLRSYAGLTNTGVNLLGLSRAAEAIGFKVQGVKVTLSQLINEIPCPSILFWEQKHFVVLMPSSNPFKKGRIRIADPAQGIVSFKPDEFMQKWSNMVDEDGDQVGFALSLEPSDMFYKLEGQRKSIFSWNLVLSYISHDYSQLFHILVTIAFSIICQLAIPYLTKELVDNAIGLRDIGLVTLLIFVQLGILFSKMIADFIRAKFLLVISTLINVNMSADFWKKLMRLPLSYFETRRNGEILQRLSDNRQIQNFLTGAAINTTFSILTCVTFCYILFSYNVLFFVIFSVGTIGYLIWVRSFFNIQRKINHSMNILATRQNDLSLQFVQGMSEIRIGNGEKPLLQEWESLQNEIFILNSKTLKYSQIQSTGGLFITQGKDLSIIFLAANMIIEHKLTLGTLLAIQYVIGALSGPIEQLISFSQSTIETKQSINRLNNVYQIKNEPTTGSSVLPTQQVQANICIKGLTFTYPGAGNKPVLNDLSLILTEGKVTAIVGLSGSGKTTLLKLLLRFYEDYKGEISIRDENLKNINIKTWRSLCGAVLQDGYIFNTTIEGNISIGEEEIDTELLIKACEIANIYEFIRTLPNGFKTKLGVDGLNISQGQKQRILIARTVYQNPSFLFFDEATNSLDAENENIIVNNLKKLYAGRTVLIIAHRLSTVKDADKIVVLNRGKIAEEGSHEELISLKGQYYKLVKNQLELGA